MGENMDRHAFYDCTALRTIVIPSTVGFFGKDVFGTDKKTNLKCTIICAKGSFADRYAQENGLTCSYV